MEHGDDLSRGLAHGCSAVRAVVALGGNAILDGDGFEDQVDAVRRTAREIGSLVDDGVDVVVTHGNGPQVGELMLQQEASGRDSRPLDVLVAETQGQIGYLLQREIDAAVDDDVAASTVTQVEVDADDPAFDEATKPVGPWYTEDEAREKEFEVAEVGEGDRRYRRVVPSPEPESVVESRWIRRSVDAGCTVVCGGGGGVPVVAGDDRYRDVEAVVDKDRTSAIVAEDVEADALVFLTDVSHVYLDYGDGDERPIVRARSEEMREHLAAGEFGVGSMKPKVESCVRFVEATGEVAAVAGLGELEAALEGDAGTQVVSPGME